MEQRGTSQRLAGNGSRARAVEARTTHVSTRKKRARPLSAVKQSINSPPKSVNASIALPDKERGNGTRARKAEEVRRLVARAQQNDREAFGQLFVLYHRPIYSLARFYLNSGAEDAVSETFLRAWVGIKRYRDTGRPFAAWLYAIARHIVADELAVRRRVVPCADPPDASEEDSPDDRITLSAAVARLPKGQRDVIELKFFMGLTNDQVSKLLNKSVEAVKAQQWRGLRRLQRSLGER